MKSINNKKFNIVMEELISSCSTEIFIRFDNRNLFILLTIHIKKKEFKIDIGNLLRNPNIQKLTANNRFNSFIKNNRYECFGTYMHQTELFESYY